VKDDIVVLSGASPPAQRFGERELQRTAQTSAAKERPEVTQTSESAELVMLERHSGRQLDGHTLLDDGLLVEDGLRLLGLPLAGGERGRPESRQSPANLSANAESRLDESVTQPDGDLCGREDGEGEDDREGRQDL